MIRKILTQANNAVMIYNPVIMPGIEKFLLQTGSRLFAWSIPAGLAAPQGSLLLACKYDVFNCYDLSIYWQTICI